MMRYMRDDLSFHDSRTYSGSIKGSEVFLLSLRMTARMECRLKPKLLRDVDHPIFAPERSASLRTRSKVIQFRCFIWLVDQFNPEVAP